MGKVTALTEDTSPSFDDLLYGVNDPGGTPASRKVTVQSAVNALEINAQTGTTYTLVLGDRAKLITMNNASANTLTIPTNASVAFPIGTSVIIRQIGAGATTVTADTGVTLDGTSAGSATASAQYKAIVITKVATNTWYIDGAVGAVS